MLPFLANSEISNFCPTDGMGNDTWPNTRLLYVQLFNRCLLINLFSTAHRTGRFEQLYSITIIEIRATIFERILIYVISFSFGAESP